MAMKKTDTMYKNFVYACGLFYGKAAPAVGQRFKVYGGVIQRNKVGRFFRPFYKAQITAVKIFVDAHIIRLFLAVQAVEVKVVYRAAIGSGVLIYQRKRWAPGHIYNAKLLRQRFDKRGFPGTHFAMKKDDVLYVLRQHLLCYAVYFRKGKSDFHY